MFYGRDQLEPAGRCPAGGGHDAYGFIFGLPHSVVESPGTQQAWRFCHKCFGMFYNGDQQGRKGRCPSVDGHEAHGFDFVLPHTAEFVQLPGGGNSAGPAGTRPTISVSYARDRHTFTVSGHSFLTRSVAHVRFVNHAALTNPMFFDTTSDGDGRINNFEIGFPINVPQTYGISANDGRLDPSDRTGTLWSNTVTVTAT
jgi:hypothetical protein